MKLSARGLFLSVLWLSFLIPASPPVRAEQKPTATNKEKPREGLAQKDEPIPTRNNVPEFNDDPILPKLNDHQKHEDDRDHPGAGLLALLVLVAGFWFFWPLTRRNRAPADWQRRLAGSDASLAQPVTTDPWKSLKRPLMIAVVLGLAMGYMALPRPTRDAIQKSVRDFWFSMRAGRGR
jgi:hypothetical protein